MAAFGERLSELRRKVPMSQEELAEKLCISRQTLSKWELGQSEPDVEKVLRLCEIFSVTPNELLIPGTPKVEKPIAEVEADRTLDIFWLLAFAGGIVFFTIYCCLLGQLSMTVALIGLGMMLISGIHFLIKTVRSRKHP